MCVQAERGRIMGAYSLDDKHYVRFMKVQAYVLSKDMFETVKQNGLKSNLIHLR